MLLFLLTGDVPLILFVGLLILCYLTGWDLWNEKDLPFLVQGVVGAARVHHQRGRLRRVSHLACGPAPRVTGVL